MAIPIITKLLSLTLIVVSGSIFAYYIFLVAVLPFVDREHSLRMYFPDPYYAVALPLIGLVLLLSSVCFAAGIVIIRATQLNDATPMHERTPSVSKSPKKKE